VLGFFLGAFLAWADWPTGREEEIGEFLFSLCFALLVPLWLLQQRYVPGTEFPALARPVPIQSGRCKPVTAGWATRLSSRRISWW
jgi:hypothetical protein